MAHGCSCVSLLHGWSQAALGHLRALLHMGVRMPAREALEAAVRPTDLATASDPVCLLHWLATYLMQLTLSGMPACSFA